MSSSALPRIYRPLDESKNEIRILNIQPSSQPSHRDASYTFSYVSLIGHASQPYCAISWCWGKDYKNNQKAITVQGELLSIPHSAFEVLRSLCIKQKKYRVWLDAVCINQDDISERSQQVSIMSDIYNKAQSTLVWLGEDDGSAYRGIESLQTIKDWLDDQHAQTGHHGCGLLCRGEIENDFPTAVDWASVTSFFSCDWFSRFWIIQEVAFSQTVCLYRGGVKAEWTRLAEIAHHIVLNLAKAKFMDETGVRGVKNTQRIGKVAHGDPAETLFSANLNFAATDPRDRMFALYGLLRRDLNAQPTPARSMLCESCRPDYNRTIADVYAAATKAALKCSPTYTDLLLDCGRLVPFPSDGRHAYQLPSWVPRYDYQEDFCQGSFRRAARLDASKGFDKGRLQHDFDTDDLWTLRLAGVKVDIISETINSRTPYHVGTKIPRSVQNELFGTLDEFWLLLKRLQPALSDAKLSAGLRMTLTAGQSHPAAHENRHQYWDRDYRAFVFKLWPEPKPPAERLSSMADGSPYDGSSDHESIAKMSTSAGPDSSLSDSESYRSGSVLIYNQDGDGLHRSGSREFEKKDIEGNEPGDQGEDYEGETSPLADEEGEEEEEEEEERDSIYDCTAQDGDLIHAERYLVNVLENCVNRVFFVTAEGRMGSGARQTQKGDWVCIPFGFPTPLILRPMGTQFILIGDAFVYDIMDVSECVLISKKLS